MTPPGTVPAGKGPGRWPRLRRRAPLAACCALLAALPFATAPGDIIADTKFELATGPARFLSSALTLWNPQQFGGLADQYVGYLFPMGPFFELARLLTIPGWVAQRLWLAALLLVAFTGVVRLAGRLAIGTPGTRLAAGLAYALSPVTLTVAGQTSGELLPIALVPWIVVPLTSMRPWLSAPRGTAARRGHTASRARAVARSAVAIALCSGLNAASAIAAIVPCAWYILTRPGAATKARMLAWWLPAAALITVSWSVPLLLLSRYGVSIVPYTESVQVTATTTSLVNILRGTENWIAYQSTSGIPNRPLAFGIGTGVLQATLAGALAALGLAGLARRDLPERRFLLWLTLGGIAVISLGYVSSLGSPLEGPLVSLINGPASPFRNLWKFDPLVRLPLAMGLAHLLAAPWRDKAPTVSTRAMLRAVTAIALASLVLPTATTGLDSPGSFAVIPSYWVAAGDWLTAHAGNQAVLVEPAAGFSEYTWGNPMDDVLEDLTNVDFAEHNLGVVGSAGNERLLNAIDLQFAAGDGSAGLTTLLARMGIKYVLVRNDLAGSQLTGTSPARVQDTIASSPGLTLAARFGPQVRDGAPQDVLADVTARYPAVEVYQVAGAEAAATVQPATGTLRVTGAPESLLTLANEGLLGSRPVLLNNDGAGEAVAGSVVTDSLRRRVVNFGQLRANYSPTLTATGPADTFLSTGDFTEPGWSAQQAVAQYSGIQAVTASSSASGLQASASQWATGLFPYSAFDASPDTMWESGAAYGPAGQWIQATLGSAIRFGQGSDAAIGVAFADRPDVGPPVTRVTVSTAAGQVSDSVRVTGSMQSLRVPAGSSDWLRITVTGLAPLSAASLAGTQVGIATIDVPGVSASRTIVAPPVLSGQQATVVLAKAQPYQSSCELASTRWVCYPQLAAPTEEQYGFSHAVTEPSPQLARARGTAILLRPSLIDTYALSGRGQPTVTASSTDTTAPQDQPWNAFDGDRSTSWMASPSDPHPALSVSWQGPQKTISQVTIERPPGATGLAQVLITGSSGQHRGAMLETSGRVRFTPMTTTSLTLTFSTDQPVQVSDVEIPSVPFIKANGQISLGCGQGPQLSVGGVSVPTEVTATSADLLSGRPVSFQACDRVQLPAGTAAVTESASDAFDIQDVVLAPAVKQGTATDTALAGTALAGTAASSPPTAATVVSWGSSRRAVRVTAATRSYLEVNENFNAGWRAVIDGRMLQPVQLDGWKQAWVLPAGTSGVVTLTYQPTATYRDAIVAGLAALLVCLAASLLPAGGAPLPWTTGPWTTEAGTTEAWTSGQRRPGRRRRRWTAVTGAAAALVMAGLVLGGYPGAVLLPVVTGLLLLPSRGRRRGRHGLDQRGWDTAGRPLLLGVLLAVASAIGAVGEHLVYSGDSGLAVTAASNAIPQVLALLVVGGIAACLADTFPSPSGRPRAALEAGPPEDSDLDAHGEDGT